MLSTWFTAVWPDLRSMGMGLMAMSAWPMSGIHMSSRLNTQDWVGKTSSCARVSQADWCFQ